MSQEPHPPHPPQPQQQQQHQRPMMMSSAAAATETAEAAVHYYVSRGYLQSAIIACERHLLESPRDVRVLFWKAFALSLQPNNQTDAIRALEPLQGHAPVALAVTAALITTHNASQRRDKQAIAQLKAQLKENQKTQNPAELTFAGRYFYLAGRGKQAKKCLDKVLSRDKSNVEALCAYGWLNLASGSLEHERKSQKFFEAALSLTQQQSIDALLGRVRFLEEREGDFEGALECVNRLIVAFPTFRPALAEKARALMMMGSWDEAMEAAQRALHEDQYDLEALKVAAMNALIMQADPRAARDAIRDLTEALDACESGNAPVYCEMAQFCSRLAQRDAGILALCRALIDERAAKAQPYDSRVMTQQARLLMLEGDFEQAVRVLSEAAKLDEANTEALHARIACSVMQGRLDQAAQELEFLVAEEGGAASNPELLHLQAIIAWRRDHDEAQAIALDEQAFEAQLARADEARSGMPYYVAYDPEFVFSLAEAFMAHVGSEPLADGDPENPVLERAIQVLEHLTAVVPAMVPARELLAEALFIANRLDDADRVLQSTLQLDGHSAGASLFLLAARIGLARGALARTRESLEKAHSLDFNVRGKPLFLLTNARLLHVSGRKREALVQLQAAMQAPGVRRADAKHPIPPQERLAVFLELLRLHTEEGNLHEAAKVMQDAKAEFGKTTEAARLSIAEADVSVARGDVDGALGLLRGVSRTSVYFTRAKMRMADIFLCYKHNRKLYASCYVELAHRSKNPQHHVLLGDAYMRIQEPQRAIQALETAMELQPDNPDLASKIGRALITTHDYARAISYLKAATQSAAAAAAAAATTAGGESNLALVHELATLHLQLQQFQEAETVLREALEEERKDETPDKGVERIMTFLKLADVYRDMGAHDQEQATLETALKKQAALLGRIRTLGDSDMLAAQREIAASVCVRLARFFEGSQSSKAQQYYNEALKYDTRHVGALLSLARLNLANHELEACLRQCEHLLQVDPHNREAALMMADVSLRKNEHDNATSAFEELLQSDPTEWDALRKFLSLLHRAGRLSEAKAFLELAANSSPRAAFDPGYHFCKGLYHRFASEQREALAELNHCRKDGRWAVDALFNMVELYLHLTEGVLFHEAREAKGDHTASVDAAKGLLRNLREVADARHEQRLRVLENYHHMAHGSKQLLQQALDNFRAMVQHDKTNVAAMLGMATALVLLKSQQQARNQLKRISKMEVRQQYLDEFQKAWLMLADMYVSSGKYDLATDLLQKCLRINKSNAKAYEMLGTIREKELAYRDAAAYYEKAWLFLAKKNPRIGYKLAFNYLKAKRFVDAVDVCHVVLKENPDYPDLKKQVLDKARAGIRAAGSAGAGAR